MTGPIRTFRAAYSAHLRSITRFLTVPGYIGYSVAGPLFALLTSWVIGSRVLSNVSYFQSLTGSSSYLTWVVIGFAFQSFIFSAAFGGAQAIRGEQEHGTAELVFITPANKVAWLIGKMAADQTFSSARSRFKVPFTTARRDEARAASEVWRSSDVVSCAR